MIHRTIGGRSTPDLYRAPGPSRQVFNFRLVDLESDEHIPYSCGRPGTP